jgi:hypothetical protein
MRTHGVSKSLTYSGCHASSLILSHQHTGQSECLKPHGTSYEAPKRRLAVLTGTASTTVDRTNYTLRNRGSLTLIAAPYPTRSALPLIEGILDRHPACEAPGDHRLESVVVFSGKRAHPSRRRHFESEEDLQYKSAICSENEPPRGKSRAIPSLLRVIPCLTRNPVGFPGYRLSPA